MRDFGLLNASRRENGKALRVCLLLTETLRERHTFGVSEAPPKEARQSPPSWKPSCSAGSRMTKDSLDKKSVIETNVELRETFSLISLG